MQYRIVSAEESRYPNSHLDELESKVQKLCNEGWKPQGGVAVVIEKAGFRIHQIAYQAMIKED